MLRVCVLGGNSFLGVHIIQRLLKEKQYYVKSFVRKKKYNYFNNIYFKEYIGNFFNSSDLETVLTDCDICIHLISTSVPQYNDDYTLDISMNVCCTLKMLDIARKKGVKKIIFASSGGTVYGNVLQLPIHENSQTNPICSYGITKLMIEKYLQLYEQQYNLKYISLRIANPYGSYFNHSKKQGLINIYINNILQNKPLYIYGDGRIIRDYIYVDDVAKAFLAAIKTKTTKHIFNIGSGKGMTILDIINILKDVTRKKNIHIVYKKGRDFDVEYNVLNINKAFCELNWRPSIVIEDGIRKTFEYSKSIIM